MVLINSLIQSVEKQNYIIVERDANNTPIFYVSSGAVVFKVKFKGILSALKCYIKQKPNLKERYLFLTDYCKNNNLDFVEIGEVNQLNIEVDGEKINSLLTNWIANYSLLDIVDKFCRDNNIAELKKLLNDIIDIFIKLIESELSHGDLKPSNILINNNQISIIDWDGAYHQKIKSCFSNECGTIGYKHPNRKIDDYGCDMDFYSMAIIVVSLIALVNKPYLYFDYSSGEMLLLSPDEIVNGKSEIYKELESSWIYNPQYIKLLQLLKKPNIDRNDILNIFLKLNGRIKYSSNLYTLIDDFSESSLSRIIDNTTGLYGYVDNNFIIKIYPIFGDATIFNSNISGVRINNKYYLIDEKGYACNNIDYDDIKEPCNGMIGVKNNGKWGFVNINTLSLDIDYQYDDIWTFSNKGIALVKNNGIYWFIDIYGKNVFNNTYLYAKSFSENGYAIIKNAIGLYMVINQYGAELFISNDRILGVRGDKIIVEDRKNNKKIVSL